MSEPTDGEVVATLLGLAGIRPGDEEVATMTRLYGAMRAGADRLWLSEVAAHEPAPVFDPAAR